MATHDYVIANQNGANTRSDLNNAFSAIVSNNSNASEPSTTYAYMWWADTTNDLLKQRNAANSAWVDILTLSTGSPSVGGATEGTAVLSTGETGGTKFLREDGDGTSSWQSISSDPTMGGDLSGTASNAQIVANAVGSAEIADNAVGNTEMADDAIGVAELSASGTASSSTYLRGDNSWATVSGGISAAPTMTSGSASLTSGQKWTPADGYYMWTSDGGTQNSVYQGGSWHKEGSGITSSVLITDGNARVSAYSTTTIYYLKVTA